MRATLQLSDDAPFPGSVDTIHRHDIRPNFNACSFSRASRDGEATDQTIVLDAHPIAIRAFRNPKTLTWLLRLLRDDRC
jgi:hypothetical protein